MDLNKLYNASINNILTDITLRLIDEKNELVLNLHKIILYASSNYFEKLLTILKESKQKEITIKVPNYLLSL